ncbi:hypothetical protein [Paracidovorax citrulli]
MLGGSRSARAIVSVAACIAAAGWPAPTLAFFDHYLSGTIVGTLSKEQSGALLGVFRETLEQAPDGTPVTFRLPADGGKRQVDGTFTPLRTLEDQGDRCRQLRSELRRTGESESWTGWYCKDKDGSWKSRKLPA